MKEFPLEKEQYMKGVIVLEFVSLTLKKNMVDHEGSTYLLL